jgi:hypothetical protein
MGLFVAALIVADAGAAAKDSAAPAGPASSPGSGASASSTAPHATQVYRSDFAKGAGAEWWPRWTSATPAGGRPFLGEFGIEPATFTCRNLPPHKFVRLTLSLFMLRPVDGSSAIWGPDPWELQVLGGPRLLYTTFGNCCFFTDNNEQAFPDDYPWAVHAGWTGAAEKQTLGYPHTWHGGRVVEDTSSVYRLTLLFPHEDKDLRFLLRSLWSEPVKEGGESWGLESLEVETLDGPLELTDQQLEALWQDLDGDDATKAFSALWTMVGGGQKTVEFIRGRMGQPAVKTPTAETGPPAPQGPSAGEELPGLLKEMDDESFQTRERATQRLREIGRPILSTLLKLAETVESPEVRVRLRRVVAELARDAAEEAAREAAKPAPKPPPPKLLAPRAVRVLETIGSPSALEVLERWSRQEDSPALPYAAAARQRLAERLLDDWLARADAYSRAGNLPAAEKLCDQAQDLAKSSLPEDERRVASVREDCRLRQKARAAAGAAADAAARREAMRHRLAVADDPAGAAQLADDPQVREALRLAAKPLEDLTDAEVDTLRAFYLKEAQDAEGTVRTNLVSLAMAAARPGSQPTDKPFERTEGVPRDLLVVWSAEQAGRGRWTDLLPLVDVPLNDKGQNRAPDDGWWREWNGVKAGGTAPFLVLPVQPVGSYQIRLTFTPVSLRGLAVMVPVGGSSVCVTVYDSEKRVAGILFPWNSAVAASAKWVPAELTPAGEYRADITVRQDADGSILIRLDVDGRKLVEWRGKASDVQGQAERPPLVPGCPIVAADGGWTLFRNISVRMLDGKLKPAPAGQPSSTGPGLR